MNIINESYVFVFLSYLLCCFSIIHVLIILLWLLFANFLLSRKKIPFQQLKIVIIPYFFIGGILIFEPFSLSSFKWLYKIRRKLFIWTCQERLKMLLILFYLLSWTFIHDLLPFIYLINLDLSPNKGTILSKLFANRPPKSTFDEPFDHVTVVAFAYVKF